MYSVLAVWSYYMKPTEVDIMTLFELLVQNRQRIQDTERKQRAMKKLQEIKKLRDIELGKDKRSLALQDKVVIEATSTPEDVYVAGDPQEGYEICITLGRVSVTKHIYGVQNLKAELGAVEQAQGLLTQFGLCFDSFSYLEEMGNIYDADLESLIEWWIYDDYSMNGYIVLNFETHYQTKTKSGYIEIMYEASFDD
jgi:hypothetical protein